MGEHEALKPLRVALVLVGILCIFGLPVGSVVWPSGWIWHAGSRPAYFDMLVGVYATLGVFLLRASRDPLANLSLIWFTVWSSVVHAAIMLPHSLMDPDQRGHLVGDIPALLIIAAIVAFLTRRATRTAVAA